MSYYVYAYYGDLFALVLETDDALQALDRMRAEHLAFGVHGILYYVALKAYRDLVPYEALKIEATGQPRLAL